MKMEYVLAIDIGASSGRHMLAHIENDKIILEEIYRFDNYIDVSDGVKTWNVKRLYNEVINGLKKAKDIGKIPLSVGIDTWGVDYVLLDGNDEVLSPVYAYRDEKNYKLSEDVSKIIPFEKLFERTGIEFAVFNTVYQLYGDKKSGKMSKAESFLMIPDYLNFLLTGVKKQEYTNATTTAMVNVKTHRFDEEVIDELGYKKSLFNELSQPGTIVGEFTEEVQAEVGYNATVILPATHDTASAVLAVPDGGRREAYISSGTWSLLGKEVSRAVTDNLKGMSFSNEGSINFNFRFQTNIMGMWIFQNVKKQLGGSFRELTEAAEKSEYTGTFDVNKKEFFAPDDMVKAIQNDFTERGITPPYTAGDICNSIFLSLAGSYNKTIRGIEEILGEKTEVLHIIGGGSQNKLLNSYTAKLAKVKVMAGPVEATAIGNVSAQLVALNLVENFSETKKMILNSFEIQEV